MNMTSRQGTLKLCGVLLNPILILISTPLSLADAVRIWLMGPVNADANLVLVASKKLFVIALAKTLKSQVRSAFRNFSHIIGSHSKIEATLLDLCLWVFHSGSQPCHLLFGNHIHLLGHTGSVQSDSRDLKCFSPFSVFLYNVFSQTMIIWNMPILETGTVYFNDLQFFLNVIFWVLPSCTVHNPLFVASIALVECNF